MFRPLARPGFRPAVACSDCSLRELCLVDGLSAGELDRLDSLVSLRRRFRRGEAIYQIGDPFGAVFAVRSGSFKTRVRSVDGREQILGFPMAGDLIGFDGIGSRIHPSEAVALEDAEVCVIPYSGLEELGQSIPTLQQGIVRVFSREIVRDQRQMLLLGTMRADERVAAFLHGLSDHYSERGFSSTRFVLRMTREEMGNYLGLKLETVSRTLSRMQADGIVRVEQRELEILAPDRLRERAGG